MNELPSLGTTLGLVLFAAPLLVVALRRARRVMPARERPAHRWPSGQAAAIVALPFVVAGLFALALAPAEGSTEAETDVMLALFGSQLLLGVPALTALILAARRPHGLASLGFGPVLPRGTVSSILLVYLPGFLVFFGVAGAWAHVCRAFGWEERQEILRLILGLQHHELVLAAIVAVGVGPFLEELLFRGFLQSFMAQVVGERWALVCASALFARLHGMPGLPALFLLSLFLGWLQLRTRCLWVPYLAHAFHNGASLAISLAAAGAVEGGP